MLHYCKSTGESAGERILKIGPHMAKLGTVWNHLLSTTQIDQIEAIQRRVLRIIYSHTNDMPYINALYCASIPSLVDRREQLSRKFFT